MSNMKEQVIKLTAEEVKNDSEREYNPDVWSQTIDRYSKFKDVEFFKASKNEVFPYDRFYVVYTLPEGLRLLGRLSYSSTISSSGFYQASVQQNEDGSFVIETRRFKMQDHGEVVINNSPEARKWMTICSSRYGMIWSKL